MKNIRLFALLMLTLVVIPDSKASECYEHRLTVARHAEVSISESAVDNTLAEASLLLNNKASGSDYSCCVQLVREGSVEIFGTVGDGLSQVDNPSELRNVWHISTHKIKVIESLSVPVHLGVFGQPKPRAGQAYPGLTMVLTESASPVIWAHEFGHFKYIWMHRDNSSANIMHTSPSQVGEINEDECNLMKAGGVVLPPQPVQILPAPKLIINEYQYLTN